MHVAGRLCGWVVGSLRKLGQWGPNLVTTPVTRELLPLLLVLRGGGPVSGIDSGNTNSVDVLNDVQNILSESAGTFITQSTTADGRCLLRALSILLYDTECYYQRIINAIVSHVADEWPAFAGIMTAGHGGFGNTNSAAEYSEFMNQPGTCGTLAEVAAASCVLDRRICVIAPDGTMLFETGSSLTTLTSGPSTETPVMLCLTGDVSNGHYQPVKHIYTTAGA